MKDNDPTSQDRDEEFLEMCQRQLGSNACSRCLSMGKNNFELYSGKYLSGMDKERYFSSVQAAIEESAPAGALDSIHCEDRTERAAKIGWDVAVNAIGHREIDEISDISRRLHDELQDPLLAELPNEKGPLKVEDLDEDITNSSTFAHCVELYGWPDESDTLLRYPSEQYPTLTWDNATFRRLLFGNEQPFEDEPQRGFGQLTHLLTLTPEPFHGKEGMYHNERLASRPALARLHVVAPHLVAEINKWLSVEATSGRRHLKPHSLQVYRSIMDQESIYEDESDQVFTNAIKTATDLLIRLVKVDDYKYDAFQSPEQREPSFDALRLALY